MNTGSHCSAPGQRGNNDATSWTAARCHRLLRPITYRVDTLRRNPIRFSSAGHQSGFPDKLTDASSITESIKLDRMEDHDADWGPSRKRLRRTYSTKSKPKDILEDGWPHGIMTHSDEYCQDQKPKLVPGEIVVPTPILNRSKHIENATQGLMTDVSSMENLKRKSCRRPRPCYATRDGDGHFQLAQLMRTIGKTMSLDQYKTYEGIYNAVKALLRATTLNNQQNIQPATEKNHHTLSQASQEHDIPRSRSLLLMCLRSVPKYIEEQETRGLGSDEGAGLKPALERPPISVQTYSDLESLGSSWRGWKHLKTIVRAHGLRVISNAIREGFIDARFSSALVLLCVHMSAQYEAETILASLLSTYRYPNPRSIRSRFRDDPALLPLVTLGDFVRYTGRTSHCHRQLTRLLNDGSLPISWLTTKDSGWLWTGVFRSLSNDPSDRDATIFLATVLPLMCKFQLSTSNAADKETNTELKMRSVVNATLSSVLNTLLALSILSTIHTRNIIRILRTAILDCGMLSGEIDNEPTVLMTMACFLVFPEADLVGDSIEELTMTWRRICHQSSTSHLLRDVLPNFVCAIARSCGRGSSADGFQHLQVIVGRLEAILLLLAPDGASRLREVVVDSAFVFAQHLGKKNYLEYAQHIQTRLKGSQLLPRAPPSNSSQCFADGFRWEEGISEWVMATPAVKPNIKSVKSSSSDDESDYEAHFKSILNRRKHNETYHLNARVYANTYTARSRILDLVPSSPRLSEDDKHLPIREDCIRSDYLHYPPRAFRKTTKIMAARKSSIRLQRQGNALLSSSQDWCIFRDHSDDELNSSGFSCTEAAILEMPDFGNSSRKSQQKSVKTGWKWSAMGFDANFLGQSEDELGL